MNHFTSLFCGFMTLLFQPAPIARMSFMKTKVRNFEENAWADHYVSHPNMHIAQACLKNVTPYHFWCLADHYSYLVSCVHAQIRLMSTKFSHNGGVP